MNADRIRVALVSDQQVLLDALSVRLDMSCSLKVVGISSSLQRGAESIVGAEADVAILDVDLPDAGAFNIAAAVRKRRKVTKLLFLASSVSEADLAQALRLKANGFLLKSEPIERLVTAVERAATHLLSFSDEVRQKLTYDDRRKRFRLCRKTALSEMTNRQLQILRHLAYGDSVKEVARKLDLTPKSVDSHKYRIMVKVGVRDRVHLARYAIREGLIRA